MKSLSNLDLKKEFDGISVSEVVLVAISTIAIAIVFINPNVIITMIISFVMFGYSTIVAVKSYQRKPLLATILSVLWFFGFLFYFIPDVVILYIVPYLKGII